MGLIERFRRITLGRIEAFLAAVERPEQILPQLIDEMKAQLPVLANAEAKSLTAVRGAQRRLDEISGRHERFRRGAELALQAGQEELARQAVAAELQAAEKMESLKKELAAAEKAYRNARRCRMRFQEETAILTSRKKDILQRVRTAHQCAEAQKDIQKAHLKQKKLLDGVAQMEEKASELESQVEIESEIASILSIDLAEPFDMEMLRDTEITARLDELKEKLE